MLLSGSGPLRRISAGLRYDAPSFPRGFSVCAPGGLWPRFCGVALRCAFVSAGLRYDAPSFLGVAVRVRVVSWGGITAGLRYYTPLRGRSFCADTSVCTEYAQLRYLFCADTSVVRARWAEAAFLRGSITLRLRFCAFLWVLRGLQRT